jgi:endonuclease/exonuclease/phosphatase family metal-dependent hydrolase
MRWTVQLLRHHGVDVVGFQEIRDDQVRAFERLTGGGWGIYPGNRLGAKSAQNSVAWRTSAWELVRADTVWIPYFNGNPHKMPYVLLEHRASGQRAFFANFHNPASVKRFGSQKRHRARATSIQIDLVRRLRAQTDLPVFVTGDMNERAEYFCRLTGATSMQAANGGSNDGPCRPPGDAIIDWIFGSPEAQFLSYFTDRGPLVRRTSDHRMVLSRVRLGG